MVESARARAKQAKEIMAELDKFLSKQQAKVEKAAIVPRKASR
jgi:hypothetical protein